MYDSCYLFGDALAAVIPFLDSKRQTGSAGSMIIMPLLSGLLQNVAELECRSTYDYLMLAEQSLL